MVDACPWPAVTILSSATLAAAVLAATALGPTGLGLLGPATPAAAAAAPVPSRANVGAPHSPELLRQLAAPAATIGAISPRAAGPAAGVPSPLAGAVQGVDVASYQHPGGAAINWADVAAAGIGFAAVKVTEGDYYVNPYALADLAQARAAGLTVAAYAFAIPNGNGASASPATQADDLVTALGPDATTMPLMLDIEYDPYTSTDHTNQCYGLSASAMVTWISGFTAEVAGQDRTATAHLRPAGLVEVLHRRAVRRRPRTRCGCRTTPPRPSRRCRAGGPAGRSGSTPAAAR